MFNLSESCETGHALIDAQHRMLIAYAHHIEGLARTTNPSRDEFELLVRFMDFLENYTLEHFREEEDCVGRIHCPVYESAQTEHREFLDFFQAFKQRFGVNGYSPELVKELFEACGAFIHQHILRVESQLDLCRTQVDAEDKAA